MSSNTSAEVSFLPYSNFNDFAAAVLKSTDPAPRFSNLPFVLRLKLIMERHYPSASFNVLALSRQLHLCEVQLNRKLRKDVGASAGKLILYYRLYKAWQLLATSEYSLKEISFLTGFSSQNNFYKAFRREIRCTPSQARKGLWQMLYLEE